MMNETQQEAQANYKTGIVIEVKKGFIRANIPEFDDFVTDWLPVLIYGDTQENKSFAMPSIGAQVALLLDGRGEDGVCLGSIYSDVDTPSAPNEATTHTKYSDGAIIEYDPSSSTLTASGFKNAAITGGMLHVKTDQTIFDSLVTINKLLTFTAGMTGSGEVAGGGGSMILKGTLMHEDGSIISNGVVVHLHEHPVTAVGANTGGPIATMVSRLKSLFSKPNESNS